MYLSGEEHTLQLHAITGQPNEKPQPKIITSMELKKFFYDWYGYNKEIFLSINHSFSDLSIQYFFKFISQIFNISSFAICYIFLVILVIFCSKKNRFSEERFLNFYNYFVKIGICYGFIGLSYALMKFTINMPRPYCSLLEGSFVTILDFSGERCLSSFPSAHTAIVILTSYALWPFVRLPVKLGLICLSLLVMLSRIILAMHYPADILYSIIIVMMIIYLGGLFYKLLERSIIEYVGKFFYKNLRSKIS